MTMFEHCQNCHPVDTIKDRMSIRDALINANVNNKYDFFPVGATCDTCFYEWKRWKINGKARLDKYNATSTITFSEWRKTLKFFGYKCAVCGQAENEFIRLVPDHWYAVALGGQEIWGNLVPLCERKYNAPSNISGCHDSKSDIPPREWLYKLMGGKGDFIFGYIEDFLMYVYIYEMNKTGNDSVSCRARMEQAGEKMAALNRPLDTKGVYRWALECANTYHDALDLIKEMDQLINKQVAISMNAKIAQKYDGLGEAKLEKENVYFNAGVNLMYLVNEDKILKRWDSFTNNQKREFKQYIMLLTRAEIALNKGYDHKFSALMNEARSALTDLT